METSPLRQTADALAASGAVMTVWNSPAEHYLVGDFSWIDANKIFWFAANGDTRADGHVLEFEEVETGSDGRVRFLREGILVGLLSPIERADVEDPDDYRVAWQIWQQVAPARHALIAEARAAHDTW